MQLKEKNKNFDYEIVPSSYQLFGSDRWRAKAIFIDVSKKKSVPFFWDIEFDSREQADQFAIQKLKEHVNTVFD